MKSKRLLAILIACVFIIGCLTIPAAAVQVCGQDSQPIMRVTRRIDISIPANALMLLDEDISLDSREIVSYDCSYTPRDASVKFGYIGPDGLFYGLSGYKGSIDKGIRVNQSGTYTLAIWNEASEAVSVWGTVNY